MLQTGRRGVCAKPGNSPGATDRRPAPGLGAGVSEIWVEPARTNAAAVAASAGRIGRDVKKLGRQGDSGGPSAEPSQRGERLAGGFFGLTRPSETLTGLVDPC